MRHLERSEQPWPKDKERVFYQIFMSDDVSRESVKYKGRYTEITFTPAKQASINGESQEGKIGPYWGSAPISSISPTGTVKRDIYHLVML